MKEKETILQVKNLKMYFKVKEGYVRAVDGVTFSLDSGVNLGLVGESGCGKTTLIKALLKILPETCHYMGGQIIYKGRDITQIHEHEMRNIRWNEISLIPQSAMNALDPVFKIGEQLAEAILAHRKDITKKDAWKIAENLFVMVGMNKSRLKDYPHMFSGGMKQRAVIAMAMALDPSIVIADEITTALDVVIQAQILERIKALQLQYKGSMIMVTHDISVVAQTCQKIAVMYGGKLMEYGAADNVLKKPFHPYSMGLKNAFPNLLGKKKVLISIPGSPPDLINPPTGCRFVERCPFALERCSEEEPEFVKMDGHMVACHRLNDAEQLRQLAEDESIWAKEVSGFEKTG